jgi:hypothetical protein
MSLTNKQIDLIKNIYDDFKNIFTFEEFLKESCQKNIEDLDWKDISKISKYANNKTIKSPYNNFRITDKQLNFIKEIIIENQLDFDLPKRNEDLKKILSYCYKNNIYIPVKINFKYLIYTKEYENNDYIIGNQLHIRENYTLKIMSFKNLLSLDYDNIPLNEIEQLLKGKGTFRIYKTYNGYHAYCTSKYYEHFEYKTLKLMYELKCDHWYISFCKYTGFTVRLKPKKDRQEEFIEKYIKTINNDGVDQELSILVKLLDIKDSLQNKFNL